ncbi:MAG: hypothetical protein NWE75_04805 [Candidatus Bathyarchaeota archaeon]|nr:hypothetical protein [Candidatus Bathyarchaeota archaeon]
MSAEISVLRVLPRDAWILVFTRALMSLSATIMSVSFPIYLSKLGASPIAIGLTFTSISLFSAFRSLLEGLITDRLGALSLLHQLPGKAV